ncbi:peptidoglycan/LPS O-acetylase OafA/YrhL [Flavobacteriaceae bacterium MAR_2010_72]|nr:peptidoglycan/LPS O-acetylase OafA/YrhL [Flavobacteriaceae bacterium MAR_2010_72]
MQTNRIFGLDALRAIAITLVVVSHCTYIFYETTENPMIIGIRSLGAIGVDLFFVLSGYLIGGILLKHIDQNRTSFKDLIRFWKRRWLRTLPNYYLVLLINIGLLVLFAEQLPDMILLYIPFLQNFTVAHPDFFSEAWSLSIEEYSYLILPLLLFCGLQLVQRHQSKTIIFLMVTLALIGFQYVIKSRFYIDADVSSYKDWSTMFRKVVIYRLDAVYYGFVLIYLCRLYPNIIRNYDKLFLTIGLLLFGSTHVFIFVFSILPQTHLGFYVFGYLTLIATCCALVFPAFLKLKKQGWFGGLIYFLSTRSYAIYLLNYSIVLLSLQKLINFEEMSFSIKLGVLVLFLVLTLIFSNILYCYFEKPILNYRDKTYSKSKITSK